MKAIWASFPAISLDWIDERLDCLVFQHCFWLTDNIGICRKVISVKMIWDLFRKDLLQESLKSTACGRIAASQIKWLSCTFTSIFGDISMTMQAETLLKGEGWRCPFTQERAGVIHQPRCCPFSTARPSYLLLPTLPRRDLTSILPASINISLSVIPWTRRDSQGTLLCTEGLTGFIIYQTWSSADDLTNNNSNKDNPSDTFYTTHWLAASYILGLGIIKVLHYTIVFINPKGMISTP